MDTNIGIIAQSASCGHSYVNKQFADVLDNVYILAAKGGEKHQEDFWDDYNTTKIDESYFFLDKRTDDVVDWVKENDLDIVLFNEMYNWEVVKEVSKHAKTVCYIVADAVLRGSEDKYRENYDELIVAAENVAERFPEAKKINWGVDLEKLQPTDNPPYLFQHNAGWGGVQYRKCTPQVLKAYNRLREKGYDFGLKLNMQANILGPRHGRIVERWDELDIYIGEMDYERQYDFGKVYVGPSEYEGLGLYFPEALASGLPVITTNKLPMSQFVEEDKTGKLVEPRGEGPHPKRDIVFPRYSVGWKQVADAMEWFVNNQDKIEEMSENARKYAEENHSLEQFKKQVRDIIYAV